MKRSRERPNRILRASLTRRGLLRAGSAGALSAALFRHGAFSFSADAKPASHPAAAVPAPLALGYHGPDNSVLDPAGLASGDTGLVADGAHLKVHGLYPAYNTEALAWLESMTIDVVYDGHPDAPFMLWSYRKLPVPQASVPFTASVPVGATGMRLLVSYRREGSADPIEAAIDLSPGQDSDLPKLLSGTYLIALPGTDESLPDWKHHQLLPLTADDGCVWLCLHEKHRNSYVPSGRPYVLLSIV